MFKSIFKMLTGSEETPVSTSAPMVDRSIDFAEIEAVKVLIGAVRVFNLR